MKANKLTLLIMLFSLLVSCNGNKLEEPATGISGLTDDVYFEQDGKINSIGSVEHYELLIKEATEDIALGRFSKIEVLDTRDEMQQVMEALKQEREETVQKA